MRAGRPRNALAAAITFAAVLIGPDQRPGLPGQRYRARLGAVDQHARRRHRSLHRRGSAREGLVFAVGSSLVAFHASTGAKGVGELERRPQALRAPSWRATRATLPRLSP
jgi:hypothetical protein